MTMSKVKFWVTFEMSFFRIPGTLEAETLVCGKPNVCFLYIVGEDKKVSFLE